MYAKALALPQVAPADVTALFSSAPAFVFVLSFFVLKERVTALKVTEGQLTKPVDGRVIDGSIVSVSYLQFQWPSLELCCFSTQRVSAPSQLWALCFQLGQPLVLQRTR